MYDTMLSIPLDSAIQRRIETLAKAAGRSEENQAAYLIEKGLHAVEQRLAAEAPAALNLVPFLLPVRKPFIATAYEHRCPWLEGVNVHETY